MSIVIDLANLIRYRNLDLSYDVPWSNLTQTCYHDKKLIKTKNGQGLFFSSYNVIAYIKF